MNKIWITWEELERLTIDKKIVLFGSGEWAEKTIRKLGKKPMRILDNSHIMQGTSLSGVKIESPDFLYKENENIIILISTGSYESVLSQLETMESVNKENIFMSPVLFNQKIDYDIKNNKSDVLFTCSDIPNTKSSVSGGGLYKFNTKNSEYVKVSSGKYHEIVKSNEGYYVVDEFEGVKKFDKNLNHIETFKGLPGSIMHGLAIDEERGVLFIGNTGRDSISLMDSTTGEHIDEIFLSRKNEEGEADRHHLNDLCYYKGDLFISMFSASGLWREGCYDGVVAKMNLKTKSIESYPIQNLWMPHSIEFINGEISIIDSMRGDVYKTNNKKLVNISGFARGLCYDGKYYYIGQSEHRYFDRLKEVSRNIHINCGIHLYDDMNKASRFYSFEKMMNIHSIISMI